MKKILLIVSLVLVLASTAMLVTSAGAQTPMPAWTICDQNMKKGDLVGMEEAGEGMTYVWNTETGKYDGPFHSVNPGETGYTDPLLPGGNIAGFYPGCALDLGSGGRYYFYHQIEVTK